MKLNLIELIEINLPLVHFFETSFGRTYERRIVLTRVVDADGAEGWGEATCGETPSYCEEWTESAWTVMEKILAPMVLGKEFESAANVWDLMKRVRGNRMAKAAIETAVLGIWKRKNSSSALETSRRRARRNRMRRFHRHSGFGRTII
jgi:O-succinylbenzoate synthase